MTCYVLLLFLWKEQILPFYSSTFIKYNWYDLVLVFLLKEQIILFFSSTVSRLPRSVRTVRTPTGGILRQKIYMRITHQNEKNEKNEIQNEKNECHIPRFKLASERQQDVQKTVQICQQASKQGGLLNNCCWGLNCLFVYLIFGCQMIHCIVSLLVCIQSSSPKSIITGCPTLPPLISTAWSCIPSKL